MNEEYARYLASYLHDNLPQYPSYGTILRLIKEFNDSYV